MTDNPKNRQGKPSKHDEDMLDRSLEQSFPASDPPAQTAPVKTEKEKADNDKNKNKAAQQGNAPQGHLQGLGQQHPKNAQPGNQNRH